MTSSNSFAVDAPSQPIVDINNPPRVNYKHQDFPKMMYHHENGRVLKVDDDKQMKAAAKRGFKDKPSPDFDYSKVNRAGIAAPADSGPKREEEMSAEELAALDEADGE